VSRPSRIRSKAERRADADSAGGVIGWAEAKRKRWARRTLMQKQRGLCGLCGEQMSLELHAAREATLDHIRPVARGGTDTITNLQLACRECNEAKGADS
jgi:5-methylcytosine-specific restriction endonuclease McrA